MIIWVGIFVKIYHTWKRVYLILCKLYLSEIE